LTKGVSSLDYFHSALCKLKDNATSETEKRALLEGYASSAGMGTESIVQASRLALFDFLYQLPIETASEYQPYTLLDANRTITDILIENLTDDRVLLPLLTLIAFLLDTQILQRLSITTNFKSVGISSVIIVGSSIFIVLKPAKLFNSIMITGRFVLPGRCLKVL
jgi:hypothetical protein